MVKDPVCGMAIDEQATPYYIHRKHETIFFCSQICRDSFDMTNETDRRPWWKQVLERIIGSNVKVFGRTTSKDEHEGRAEYPVLQQEVRVSKIQLEIDPVCRMEIQKGIAPAVRSFDGKKYFFCAVACADRFDKDPERYAGGMK